MGCWKAKVGLKPCPILEENLIKEIIERCARVAELLGDDSIADTIRTQVTREVIHGFPYGVAPPSTPGGGD